MLCKNGQKGASCADAKSDGCKSNKNSSEKGPMVDWWIGAVGRSSVVADAAGTVVLVGLRMDQRCYMGAVAFPE